jgi:hypothetical protein
MSTQTITPVNKRAWVRGFFRSPAFYAIVILTVAALVAAMAAAAIPAVRADQADKRAAFEKVLEMSSAELESKTLPELNGYRKDIRDAADYGLGFTNVTGYSSDVVKHKIEQVNALILKKVDQ